MKFKVLNKTTPFKQFFQIDIYDIQHELFAGGWSDVVTREVFERSKAVAVLVHDPKADNVLLVEQFRPGAIYDENGPWMLEIVAGMVEAGENNEDVARREAQEEAACTITDLEFVMDFYPSAGGSTEVISLYYATVDLSGVTLGIHGLETENEDIRTSIESTDTVMDWLKAGKIKSALTIIALQWLSLRKAGL